MVLTKYPSRLPDTLLALLFPCPATVKIEPGPSSCGCHTLSQTRPCSSLRLLIRRCHSNINCLMGFIPLRHYYLQVTTVHLPSCIHLSIFAPTPFFEPPSYRSSSIQPWFVQCVFPLGAGGILISFLSRGLPRATLGAGTPSVLSRKPSSLELKESSDSGSKRALLVRRRWGRAVRRGVRRDLQDSRTL